MYKILFTAILSLSSMSTYAGLFGPSDIRECILKHQSAVKLEDAKLMLRMACVFGYGDGDFDREQKKIGKCIASDAKNFYSFESTLKVVNKCTGSNVGMFTYFKNQLFSNQNDRIAEERNRHNSRRRLELEEGQNGPVTIFDYDTGTYKYCHRTGGNISCF